MEDKVRSLAAAPANVDSVAIAENLHRFFKWYAETGDGLMKKINFINEKGPHPTLDETLLSRYYGEFLKTGLISSALVEDETKFYRACAELWKKEKTGGLYSGFDYDRYYCENDGDIAEFQKAGVSFRIRGDFAKVRLMLEEKGPNHGPREFEMLKENENWTLSKLHCNSGVKY